MKELLRLSFLLIISLNLISCEDSEDDNNDDILSPNISVTIAGIEADKTIYVYGPSNLNFIVTPKKGEVHAVEVKYQHTKKEYNSPFGYFSLTPQETEINKEVNLEISATVKIKNITIPKTEESYKYVTKKIVYKVKYVKVKPEDFIVKSQELDQIILQMVNKNENPCQYVFDGKKINDLDHIVFKRNKFPGSYTAKIYLLPENAPIEEYSRYNHVEVKFADKILGKFHFASSVDHYVDQHNKELYVWSMDDLFIHDKNMEIVAQKRLSLSNIFVTPKTGLIVCHTFYEGVKTYSDKTFSKVVSKIHNTMPMRNLAISNLDQLFQGHNFQVDIFDLHTGNMVYSIKLPNAISDFSISPDSKYLFVRTQDINLVYGLNSNSADLLYSFVKNFRNTYFHPINSHHVILDNTYNGFEIFDIDTKSVVYSNAGEYQSVDPISGHLLFYDKDYSYPRGKYDNHFIDKAYNQVYTFIDNTQSTYGAYKQFNGYIIKDKNYVNVSPNLVK